MVKWLVTVHGSATTTAPGQGGTFTLESPDVLGAFTYIRVPKGLRVKVWARRLSGTVPFRLLVRYTSNVTVAEPTWSVVDSAYLASPGSVELEKRRPVVVVSGNGTEAVSFAFSDSGGAGVVSFSAEIEVTDEDE